MARPRTQRKPTFLWQALLILLPVVVLAVVGSLSLRQDRILAEHTATECAQAIADDLLARVWAELSALANASGASRDIFQIDEAGQLVFPPPHETVPQPQPLDLTELTPEQARLWQDARATHSYARPLAVETYRAFIAANPPRRFAAAAHYELGLLLHELDPPRRFTDKTIEAFDALRLDYPGVLGESGLPLRVLAEFKLLEWSFPAAQQPGSARVIAAPVAESRNVVSEIEAHSTNTLPPAAGTLTLDSFCSNAVWQPTPLTRCFLNRLSERVEQVRTGLAGTNLFTTDRAAEASVSRAELVEAGEILAKWRLTWEQHEEARRLYGAAVPVLDRHLAFVQTDAGRWLIVRMAPALTNRTFVCRPVSQVANSLGTLIAETRQLPDHFGVGLELGGERPDWFDRELRLWREENYFGRGGGGIKRAYLDALATKVLASASRMEDGLEILKVQVYLTSPTTLFKLQRARTFWFGALIAVSAIAALIGLAAAWRAFQRQLRLSEMKSNFVSSVSHELRAPIASVRLLAESLERGKVSEPAKQHEYFRFIGQECRRLSALIENVLDFSRIEQGRKQYESEPTDLAALVSETVKLMQPYAEERGVELKSEIRNPKSEMGTEAGTTNIQHSTPNIECSVDGRAIQQALVNLLDNAIKHSPKGETVTVGLEVRSATCEVRGGDGTRNPQPAAMEGSRTRTKDETQSSVTCHPPLVTLSVSDHGPGIPASEHARIFERFYRLGSELRRETQGVGIGLSIVKHIVEAHGGCVRVESEVGKGSRFAIELPWNETSNTQHSTPNAQGFGPRSAFDVEC
jgi:signal transduction histidine kinase